MKTKNIVIVIIALVLEFFRDYCFINLNLYIEYLENINNSLNVFNYTDSFILNLINGFPINYLYILKWILSLFFALAFIGIGILFSKLNFSSSKYKKFLKSYVSMGFLILLISFILYYLGRFLSIEEKFNFYIISLELSHFIQSSLYPIIYILMFWALNKEEL
jgi:hypothetical protein|tara:strand:- start:166 stop:654 length:489 start_codon:yes stop_codon:yes gene_type:complete